MLKRYGCCLVSLVLLVTMTGCGKTERTSQPFDTEGETTPAADSLVSENETYRMEWDSETMSISLIDKQTGLRWGTSPGGSQEPEYDELGMPVKKHPQIESALFVEYLDAQSNTVNNVISYTGAVRNGRVCCESISDGLLVKYYFDEVELMIPVEYQLRESGVTMRIDPQQIQEGDNQVVRLSLAPFWCSVSNTKEDGYLLVPSGSGALVYPKQYSQSGQSYSAAVYGRDAAIEVWDDPTETKSVRLPVYGAKSEDKATLAIIEKGAESAYIEVKSGSTSLGYSSVYATFQLRGYTDNVASLPNWTSVKTVIYADNMIQSLLQVGFYPLKQEDANYSAMAAVYRDYLTTAEGMPDSGDDVSLALNMIGGAMIRKSMLGIPYKTLYPTTTFQQAEGIIRDLTGVTGVYPTVNLQGFGKSGLDIGELAGGFSIHSKLGSVKDLQALADYCGVQIPLFMDFNLTGMAESGNGYSAFFDSARSAGGKVAYCYGFNIAVRSRQTSARYALLARSRLADSVTDLLKKTASWGIKGVGISTLSNTAYSDYKEDDTIYYAKGNMAADVSACMGALRADGKTILVNDANAYAAAHADIILRAPTQSSREDIFDEDIPFYEMVFKGHVPMTCESVNQTPDATRQLLQAVEGGCGLTYTVIASYEGSLIDAASTAFYNSLYDDIRPQIIESMAQLSAYYKKIAGAEIQQHTILENGLRETVFNNGVCVYVNYTQENLGSPNGSVPPMSFQVRENGV